MPLYDTSQLIGQGDTRDVYNIPGEPYVAKVGDNAINLQEYKAWTRLIKGTELETEFAEIDQKRHADDYEWIVMEQVLQRGSVQDINEKKLRDFGLIPGNIKPENIGVTRNDKTVLIDYPWAAP